MSYLNQVALAGGTLACAVGIGFIMQGSDAAQQRYGNADTAQLTEFKPAQAELIVAPTQKTPTPEIPLLEISSIALTSALPESITQLGDMIALGKAPAACEISVTANVLAAAMVDISLKAPCLGNERVTVHHSGIMFTQTTAVDGSLNVLVPAMNEQAFFMFVFADGDGASVQVQVDRLEFYDRIVMQWKDDIGFQIHAREFGANYGEKGHVWAYAPGDMKIAARGEGGFLTRLGDVNAPEPLLAEVYTFPTGTARENGIVALSVETEITSMNCGRDIIAQSLEMREAGRLHSQDLLLSVPNCDAIGDILVLNNLLEDLKVARN